MIVLKSSQELARMREAGRIVAEGDFERTIESHENFLAGILNKPTLKEERFKGQDQEVIYYKPYFNNSSLKGLICSIPFPVSTCCSSTLPSRSRTSSM